MERNLVATPGIKSKNHFVLLDALRGSAALFVLVYHVFEGFATSAQDQVCNHGYLAVDFFFMLSGFVIGYAYDDRWTGIMPKQFFQRRLIRLHPMLLAGMALGFFSFLVGGCCGWDGGHVSMWRVVLALVAGMVMIPSYPGSAYDVRGYTEMYSLNGPAWSLFFEYVGNILYALLLRRLPTWALSVLVVSSGMGLAWVLLGHGALDYGWTLSTFWPGMLRLLFPYTLGLLMARLHVRRSTSAVVGGKRPAPVRMFFLFSAILGIIFCMPYLGDANSPWVNGIYILFSLVFVFPFVIWMALREGTAEAASLPLLRFFGEMSYPLYLVHYPFMYLFYQYIGFPDVSVSPADVWIEALLVASVSACVAYLLLRFYDRPVRKWLSSRLCSRVHAGNGDGRSTGCKACVLLALLVLGASFSDARAEEGSSRMMFGDTTRVGKPYSKDPHVVRFKGRYLMYYSIPPRQWNGMEGWNIGIAESRDLVNWEKVGEVTPQEGLDYEKKGLCAPGALVRNGKVHLFYQTYGNGPADAVCHAVSGDGIHFERDATNPIFHPAPSSWTCGRAIDAEVAYFKGKYYLYFATRDPEFKVQKLGVAVADGKSDFSRDTWQLAAEGSILQPELDWEGACIEGASICVRDGVMWMFYAGAYNNSPQQVGVASSHDGIHFTRLSNLPFKPNGKAGEWNSSESGHPHLFSDRKGRTYLFYQGNNDNGKSWLITQEEVLWTKEGKPYLSK